MLASNGLPGSMVVVCTDGLSNVGLGNLDIPDDNESRLFYEKLAVLAKEKGVVISIITVKGEGCKMEILGKLAEETNGNVTIIDPAAIGKDFANILKDEVLATKVDIKVRLSKCMKFRKEEEMYLAEEGSVYQKEVGNATLNTKLTFEYTLREEDELKKLGINLKNIKKVPF